MALQDLNLKTKSIKSIDGGSFDDNDGSTFDVFLEEEEEDDTSNQSTDNTEEFFDDKTISDDDADDSYDDDDDDTQEDDDDDDASYKDAQQDDDDDDDDAEVEEVKTTSSSRENDRIRSLIEEKKLREQQVLEKEEENYKLRKQMIDLQKATKDSSLVLLKEQMEALKKQMARAQEEGDHTLSVELQAKLNQAQLNASALESWKAPELPEKPTRQQQQTQEPADISTAPPATRKWLRQNSWFQQPATKEDSKRQKEAIAYASILAEEGYSYDEQEFFDKIDKRLRQLGLAKPTKKGVQSKMKDKNSSNEGRKIEQRKKISQTVQSASRSTQSKALDSNSRKKVTLSPEQQRIADLFEMTYQEYAIEMLKREKAEKAGSKMTPLDI